MSEGVERKIAKAMSAKIAEAFRELFAEDESFWGMLDEEITQQIKASEHEDAQLWLSSDGKHTVCVSPFGADEPIVMPFFIPEPSIPVKAEFLAQVEESEREIKTLRDFAAQINQMADDAQQKLDAIMGKKGRSGGGL